MDSPFNTIIRKFSGFVKKNVTLYRVGQRDYKFYQHLDQTKIRDLIIGSFRSKYNNLIYILDWKEPHYNDENILPTLDIIIVNDEKHNDAIKYMDNIERHVKLPECKIKYIFKYDSNDHIFTLSYGDNPICIFLFVFQEMYTNVNNECFYMFGNVHDGIPVFKPLVLYKNYSSILNMYKINNDIFNQNYFEKYEKQ